MARPLRIEFAGAVYHVTARGNERKAIYRSETDRLRFLAILGDVVEQFRVLLHAYVLMDNHYHLLLETLEANLSRVMRELNGTYAQFFNRSHRRVGHLLQGRYKSPLIQRDSYLVEVSRYIHLNPVRAGIVSAADDYVWSSAPAYVGKCAVPRSLTVSEVLGHFDSDERRARRQYAAFLRDGAVKPPASPLERVVAQTLLGEPDWVSSMRERIDTCIASGRIAAVESEQPAVRKLRPRPSAAQVIAAVADATTSDVQLIGRPRARSEARAIAMYLVRRCAGLRLNELATIFGIKRSGVSKAIRRLEHDIAKNRSVRRRVATLSASLQRPASKPA